MSIKRAAKLLGWGAAVAVVGTLAVSPAYAEGSRTRDFTDANPGFNSYSWVDNQKDSANTVIKWSNCTKTNGGKVTSIEVKLVDQWGALPDATVGDYRTINGVCGSSTWYKSSKNYTLRDSSFYWEFGAINGNWSLHYLNGTAKATY